MNLGIFKVNHLGDNVVFLPVVQALRRHFPAWELTLVADPRTAALYAADIASDRLLTATPEELQRAWRRPPDLVGWIRRLRARRLDCQFIDQPQAFGLFLAFTQQTPATEAPKSGQGQVLQHREQRRNPLAATFFRHQGNPLGDRVTR